MKNCINCGSELQDSAKFCQECGTKQPEPQKYCIECGEELPPNAKFCPECGTPLGSPKNNKTTSSDNDITENEDEVTLSEKMKEFLKKGGVVLYNDDDFDYIDDNVMPHFFPLIGRTQEEMENWMTEITDKINPEEIMLWDTFGETAKNEDLFGEPADEYDRDLKYTIINDTLVIVGEGDTFRVLSKKDQEEAKNYWVVNEEILRNKDKITKLFFIGENTSIRARVFKDLTNLEFVALSEGIIDIRLEAFAGCPIKFLYLPESIEQLVETAFVGAKLPFLLFPPLKSDPDDWELQDDIFVDCKELKYVFIPESIEDAYDIKDFFKNCLKLDFDNVWHLSDLK